MATNVNVTSNFSGVSSKELFLQSFKKSDTLSKNAISVMTNVIGEAYLPKLSYSDTLKLKTCGWNPTGTLDLEEKTIYTKTLEVKNETCKSKFAQTFQSMNGGLFSAHSELPSDIKEGILMLILNNLGQSVESLIWTGNNTTNQINGLLPQLTIDTDVIGVSASSITKSNVVGEIEKVYDLIPEVIDGEADLIIAVSKNVAKAYKSAQASMGVNTTVGDKELDYMGYRIVDLSGLPSNTMIAYRVSNFWLATGLESDLQEIRVIDTDVTTGDDMIRYKVNLLLGVSYVSGNEVVLYS